MTKRALLLLILGPACQAQAQFDQQVLMKWAGVTKVRYEVVGEFHQPQTLVIGDGGDAEVRDRVEMTFIYDQTGAGLVGEVAVQDFPSTVTDVRSREKTCEAPEIDAPYEHYTVRGVENGVGGYLHVTSVRNYAGGNAPALCSGSRVDIAARTEEALDQLVVPAATLLALPTNSDGSNLVADPGTDTIVVQEGGWSWTYRLTPAE